MDVFEVEDDIEEEATQEVSTSNWFAYINDSEELEPLMDRIRSALRKGKKLDFELYPLQLQYKILSLNVPHNFLILKLWSPMDDIKVIHLTECYALNKKVAAPKLFSTGTTLIR
jgi:hypothetical protein